MMMRVSGWAADWGAGWRSVLAVLGCAWSLTALAGGTVDGACGPAAGRHSPFFPSAGLCTAGSFVPRDTLALDGGFNWSCAGSRGGSSAQCSAVVTAPPFLAPFTAFESGQVRPLALSPDGGQLFAVNTPDNRLSIYTVTDEGLQLEADVAVGLEPVAVAVRTNPQGTIEAWVVNHLSDSVSVVSINAVVPEQSQVTRTLLVGDEPRDIVFAGSDRSRAFITAAHRGQNRQGDPQLLQEGVGRADVWVFDANALGSRLGGSPLTVLTLFGDTPRALAVSPDGASVYAAVFHSGNRTTTLPQPVVSAGLGLPPAPAGAEPDAPEVGLIVKNTGSAWVDELGRDWTSKVPFSLPDYDVFRIDANASVPKQTKAWSGVGTVLFNMAVRPDNGKLYVSNTEALNQVRFEPVLTGQFIRNRISVLDGAGVSAHHLNPHIDYSRKTGPADEIAQSLATPMGMAFAPDGQHLYLAAFGSAKVSVLDTNALEGDSIQQEQIAVGMGPSGLVLDAVRDRLYVLNRLDNSISIVHGLSTPQRSVATLAMHNPEPESIRNGRRFLYDATTTSGHGDVSCSSCHVFGDNDQLAWDLGDPYGAVLPFANLTLGTQIVGQTGFGANEPYHPMKGPMATQSLRGMAGAGPMHWRGEKTGGLTPEGELDPDGDPMDEHAAFTRFNPAFVGLQGAAAPLSDADMDAFADFVLQLRYPPNPIRHLDDSLSVSERRGQGLFFNNELIPGPDAHACQLCHALPLSTTGVMAKAPAETTETAQDEFKIPHLRNLYTKVGMFGAIEGTLAGQPEVIVGDQVRGFGFQHDASISTIDVILHHPSAFITGGDFLHGDDKAQKRADLQNFLFTLDTGFKPAVGQQVTVQTGNRQRDPAQFARLELLINQARRGAGDLIAKGIWDGAQRGALMLSSGAFETDRAADGLVSQAQLFERGGTLTFTLVPYGNGLRMGIDRDLDGFRDNDGLPLAEQSRPR